MTARPQINHTVPISPVPGLQAYNAVLDFLHMCSGGWNSDSHACISNIKHLPNWTMSPESRKIISMAVNKQQRENMPYFSSILRWILYTHFQQIVHCCVTSLFSRGVCRWWMQWWHSWLKCVINKLCSWKTIHYNIENVYLNTLKIWILLFNFSYTQRQLYIGPECLLYKELQER